MWWLVFLWHVLVGLSPNEEKNKKLWRMGRNIIQFADIIMLCCCWLVCLLVCWFVCLFVGYCLLMFVAGLLQCVVCCC